MVIFQHCEKINKNLPKKLITFWVIILDEFFLGLQNRLLKKVIKLSWITTVEFRFSKENEFS